MNCAEGQWVMSCRRNHNVRIDQFAPDLALSEFEERVVDMADVQLQDKIGEGGFGSVYRCLYQGEVVAAKILDMKDRKAEEISSMYSSFKREVFAMAGLKHPNIVNLKVRVPCFNTKIHMQC